MLSILFDMNLLYYKLLTNFLIVYAGLTVCLFVFDQTHLKLPFETYILIKVFHFPTNYFLSFFWFSIRETACDCPTALTLDVI